MQNLTIEPETLHDYLVMATTGEGDLRAALEHCVSELIGIGYQLRARKTALATRVDHVRNLLEAERQTR